MSRLDRDGDSSGDVGGLWSHPLRLVAAAPLIFLLHVLEEAPGFVDWLNRHVEPDITTGLFLAVNLGGFAITMAASIALLASGGTARVLLATAWFGFVFLANAVLHLTAWIVFSEYAPGMVTSGVLYLPFFALFSRRVLRSRAAKPLHLVAAATIGSLPMLWHGYRIVFEGGRLF